MPGGLYLMVQGDYSHLNRREKRFEAFQIASWFDDLKQPKMNINQR